MENLKVKDIMTRKLVTVSPDDSIVYAAKLLSANNYNGLPVINSENALVGILTEYDFLLKSDVIRLPTLINILGNIGYYKKDKKYIIDDLRNLLTLKVSDVMNTDPLAVEENAWIQEAADLFAHHHRVNPIPVVNESKKLVGIVSRFDLVKLFADSQASHRDTGNIDKKIDNFILDFERRFTVSGKKTLMIAPVIYVSLILAGCIILSVLIFNLFTF